MTYREFNNRLLVFWNAVNVIGSQPIVALLALLWVGVSFFLNRSTGNHYDPGMLLTNFLQNALQLVLLFVACSLSYSAAHHSKAAHQQADAARIHAANAHAHIKKLGKPV